MQVSDGVPKQSLVNVGTGAETSVSQLPANIVFDRMYLHSFSTALSAALKWGIVMNGTSVAVIDSYIDDMQAAPAQITPADDGESKALLAWNSPGPFKVVNNFLQAAAVNVMFGGSDPNNDTLQPADLEFRRNYVRKDETRWRFTIVMVKNNFELKNMSRSLVEGNRFEFSWGGDPAPGGDPVGVSRPAQRA